MNHETSTIIKKVFDHMQDDESRIIFQQRMLYLLDGNADHLFNMLRAINEFDKSKPSLIENAQNLFSIRDSYSGQSVVLYGAGALSLSVISILERLGIKPNIYCDSNPQKWNTFKDGMPIISPETLSENYPDSIVIISSSEYETEIYESLIKIGIVPERIFLSTFSEKQYFGVPFMQPQKDEVYLDVGAFDGNTIIQFSEFCGNNYKKIYGMEADPESFQKTRKCIANRGLPRVSLIGKGAWSCETQLRFEDSASGSSRVTPDGETVIPVTTIDKIAGNDDVTLIKMDIEGSELEALKGSKSVISRCKPKLAICVYHKPEDILEIPIYLLKLNPEYKFYVRHQPLVFHETVLYAIPQK